MSGMRWADSDSESEEEYVPPSQPRSQEPPRVSPALGDRPAPAPLPPPDQGGRGGRGGGHRRSDHDDRGGGDRGGGGGFGAGGRGWDRGGRGRGGGDARDRGRGAGRHHQPNTDWKQMAKESSRFSGENGQVDGSAWMEQRRVKREQDEKERNEENSLRRQKAEEEKRERRKEQLSALKAAVVQIKEAPPSSSMATTSLQRAAMLSEPLPSLPHSSNRKPTAILSRTKAHSKNSESAPTPPKDEGRWPRAASQVTSDKHNRAVKSVEKQLDNLAMSNSPKTSTTDGPQPADTFKVSQESFDKRGGDSGRNERESGDDAIAVNTEDKSVHSGGSNNRGEHNSNPRNTHHGRSGHTPSERKTNGSSAGGEDASIGSSVSRGSGRGRGSMARGGRGGRGRGRHEHDSNRGGPGRHEPFGRGGRGRHEHASAQGSPEHDSGRGGRGRQGRGGRSRGRGGRSFAKTADKGTDGEAKE